MAEPNPFQQRQQPEVDEFELMRQRLRKRGAVRGEDLQRQVSRDFAALGNLPSGAALKQRQLVAQASEEQTGRELQDVSILEAQTRRAERESAADRGLQRDLGQLQSKTQLGVAGIGAKSALDVANIGSRATLESSRIGARSAQDVAKIRGEFGIQEQQLAISGARENLKLELANKTNLAKMDQATKTYLADLDYGARMKELQVNDKTARFLGQMSLENQMTMASIDAELRGRNMDLQEVLTKANISSQEMEGQLNTYATWVNSIGPLKQAGFDDQFINAMKETIGIDWNIPEIQEFEQRQFAEEQKSRIRAGAANIRQPGDERFDPVVDLSKPVDRQPLVLGNDVNDTFITT